MLSEMGLCTWDPNSGVLTTLQDSAKNHNLAELKKAAWYKDAFEDLGAAKQGGLKPPPESLFNLDKDRSVKTIHLRNDNWLAPATGGLPPPQKKSNSKVVNLVSSDEDSASSSSEEGLRSAATNGDFYDPSSSVEDNGLALATADGG
jgi:hypothetical protein